ncbi:bacteriohemerythrin [Syntrophomonas erecta]
MIKWKDEYSLGIERIDEQHRQLFAIADKAYQVLKDDLCIDKYDQIVAIMDELKSYAVFHFRTEEEYMRSIGYKRYLSHKVSHADFIEQTNDIDLTNVDINQDNYLLKVLDFIVTWIDQHILGQDKLIVKSADDSLKTEKTRR